jgi:hypothetical protein
MSFDILHRNGRAWRHGDDWRQATPIVIRF